MNISRRTNWTKAVLTLLLACAATCSLMTAAKLQGSTLTSEASYVTNEKTWSVNDITPLSWSQNDEYTVQYSGLSISPNENGYDNYIAAVGLSISVSGGADLEYYLQLIQGNSVILESSWKSVNELQFVSWDWDSHSYSSACTVSFYVRRADEEPLNKSSLYMSSVFAYGFNDVPFEYPTQTTAIPPEWLDTTTQTYETATTATKPVAYDDLVGTVPVLSPDVGGTPPAWFEQFNPMDQDWFVDIISGLADWFNVVNTIANQIPIFWVFGGFVITGLLLAWLLH